MRRKILCAGLALAIIFNIFIRYYPSRRSKGYLIRLAHNNCDDNSIERTVFVTVHSDGSLSLNTESLSREIVAARLYDIYRLRAERAIYLSADPEARFQDVAETVDLIKHLRTTNSSAVSGPSELQHSEPLNIEIRLITPAFSNSCQDWIKTHYFSNEHRLR